jgi:hypothetical protein
MGKQLLSYVVLGESELVKRTSVNNKKDKTFFKMIKTINMCIFQDLK